MGRNFIRPKKTSKLPKTPETPAEVKAAVVKKMIKIGKGHYADPQIEEDYAHMKNLLWGKYQAAYFPAFKQFRELTYGAAVKMSANPARHHVATIKKMAKYRRSYVKEVLGYFQEYVEDLTAAWIKEKLANQGINLKVTGKLAADLVKAESAPKPKREIVDRKTAKARAKAKTASNTRKRRGKKV